MPADRARKRRKVSGFSITGKILFANCIVVAIGAFSGTWLAQFYENQPAFVMGAVFFTGGMLLCLPANYLAVRSALGPLRRLAQTMEKAREGDLEAARDRADYADPHLALLSASYNDMLRRLERDRETIAKLSLVDPLTNMGNTRALHEGIEKEIARIDRYGREFPTCFSLLIIDLDNFKQINDTFGHMSGDAVLREMASLLERSLRKSDTTLAALKHYRFGGDEFVVIAPHTDRRGAEVLSRRLDAIISGHDFLTHEGVSIRETAVGPLRASIGFASYPEETTSADELMSLADKRMYADKKRHKQGFARLPESGMTSLGLEGASVYPLPPQA